MQPQDPYQSAPQQPSLSQYDFITKQNQPGKKSPLRPNGSFKKQLLLLLGGATILILIVVVLASVFFGGKTNVDLLVVVAQDQQEITRISKTYGNQVLSQATKNFAINTQIGVANEQGRLTNYLGQHGTKIDQKVLILKQDSVSDQQLTTAKSTNTLDGVYARVMQTKLVEYRADIATAYKATSTKATKDLLDSFYASSALLLKQAAILTGDIPADASTD